MDSCFSYPVSTYTEHGRNIYVYRCNRCQKEVAGYRKMRVRGHITCFSCKKEIAKQKYNARKTEEW
jgi:hypothetical protein